MDEEQIRQDERARLFYELARNWPRGNPHTTISMVADDNHFYRKLGQNQGRKACWKVIEQVFDTRDDAHLKDPTFKRPEEK